MARCTQHQQCVNTAMLEGDRICRERGLKFTRLRRKVLSIVWQSHTPSKAYDILQKLSEDEPSAKPPTVYRALDFLQQNGLVHKLTSLNAFVGCSHPSIHTDCYFLICSRCEEVTECCSDHLNKAIDKTVRLNNFHIQQTHLEVRGLCESCISAT